MIILVSIGANAYAQYWPKLNISVGGQEMKVLVANNEKHWQKGWSGKKDMGLYSGMLFTYPAKSQHVIFMRDMNFPIDIIWLSNGEVVDMAPNVQPEPNRLENELRPYFARLPSNAVLEFYAGFITKNGVKIGDRVKLVND